MDMRRQIRKAFLHRVKAGKSAEHGKMRRPDMRWNKLRVRAGFQRQLQQVAAVQPQDRASVRANVANRLQAGGKLVRRFQAWQQNHIMYLPRPAAPLVDRTDLAGHDKIRRLSPHAVRQAQRFPQGIHTVARRHKLLFQLRPPCWMGKVTRADQPNALASGPPVQMRRIAIPTGCARKT